MIADFRKDNGEAIRLVCRKFVMLCQKRELFTDAFVAIDGSCFKAKLKARLRQVDESMERYLGEIVSADRQEAAAAREKRQHLKDKVAALKKEMAHECTPVDG